MTAALETLEDITLIRRALAGQAESFAALLERHSVALRKRIRSMVPNAADAEDLLQEVWLKVWRHLSTFRAEASFGTWVTRVAINEVLQSYRYARRRPNCQALVDLNAFVCPSDSPHQSLARLEVTHAVRSAVVRLPEKYREVLILRDLEQRTERETAHWLDLNVPAVKTRLFRARHMLSTKLRPSGMRARVPGC